MTPLRGVRADRVVRPYGATQGVLLQNGGAMYPKGTCSASLHCVGIAPYETSNEGAFV